MVVEMLLQSTAIFNSLQVTFWGHLSLFVIMD